jgi:hypothetical protein
VSRADAYQEIAKRLLPELPSGWSEARVLAEMRADNGTVVGFGRLPSNPGTRRRAKPAIRVNAGPRRR